MKTRALIHVELRRFFSFPGNLRVALLIIPAIWCALWEHTPSPFIPIFALLFIGLESQYCNIFFRTPNEFEALSLMPVSWKEIILAKNLASILITLVCLPIVTVFVLYFSPDSLPAGHFLKAGLYLVSVIFPLLHVGNLQSWGHPRRRVGWRMDDLAGGVLMGIFTAVLSLPYFLLVEVAGAPLFCVLYSLVAGYFWFSRSLQETAHRVTQRPNSLCTAR
jgi:hypothetical protein